MFESVDRLEQDVDTALQALLRVMPRAAAFVSSVHKDRERHRRERGRLRRRLGLGPAVPGTAAPAGDATLEGLRRTQQALVHAHAEGLPAVGDALAVDRLAVHLVDLARQLAIIDMWLEQEELGG